MSDLSLYVQCSEDERLKIDLSDVWMHGDVIDEDTMHSVLVNVIAVWALENGNSFDDIVPLTVDDEYGNELEISQENADKHNWIREVVQLYVWMDSSHHHVPDGALLGYIDNEGWEWFNFDSGLQWAEDEYDSQFDGDYEFFAKEQMERCGESIPSHLEQYFDYSSYGEELIESYSEVEWGGEKYLFSE